jgi:glutamate formiminotransferase/formiminotetrahydrofolate cyclodeaminase
MNQSQPILECVPNFSEGNDIAVLDQIAAAIRSVPGAALLHIDRSPAANRTVMTFAGAPEAVTEAAFRAVKTAAELIDMSQQAGVHPRVGATDVCPLIPLRNMTMEEAVIHAQQLGARIGNELSIPVYLYEHSATQAHRRALPDIRKGQYEGLAQKMQDPAWQPDFGPHSFNPRAGATVLGARDILVAFNISLHSTDLQQAEWIARRLRESGYTIKEADGSKTKVPGRLQKLRAIGWYMADYEQAQVSLNLLDYRVTSPLRVWQTCKELAAERNISLAGSEVIGLIPEQCLLEAGNYALREQGVISTHTATVVQAAIKYLGLDVLKPFDPEEKVLEYALAHHLS